jgi:hypothetical protein
MRHHDEKIYRRPTGRPSLKALESQLVRCRQDYERMSGKDISETLRVAMKEKIAELESEISRIKKTIAANAAATAMARTAEGEESGAASAIETAGGRRSFRQTQGTGTRAVPPRFRASIRSE